MVNSLASGDTIWCGRIWLTLTHVMAGCHQTPRHCLNSVLHYYQCVSMAFIWEQFEQKYFKYYKSLICVRKSHLKLQLHLPGTKELSWSFEDFHLIIITRDATDDDDSECPIVSHFCFSWLKDQSQIWIVALFDHTKHAVWGHCFHRMNCISPNYLFFLNL